MTLFILRVLHVSRSFIATRLCSTIIFALICAAVVAPRAAQAATGFAFGGGLIAQNSFGRTTNTSDGAASTFGSYIYPLGIMYEFELFSGYRVAPSLWYTPMTRSSGGATAQTTYMHLSLPVIFNLYGNEIQMTAGPGLSMYTIKGAGGTKSLNNGTSTSTFGVPSGTSSVKTMTADLGFAYTMSNHRLALDFYIEGFMSSTKRTFNVGLNYLYFFGDLL